MTLWDRREAFHHSRLVENVNAFNPINTQTIDQLQGIGFFDLKSFEFVVRTVTNQAFMLATDDIFWLSGCIFVVLLGLTWLAKPPFSTRKIAVE